MTKPAFDFRDLTVDERLQLVEKIWDSIVEETEGSPDAFSLTEEQRVELERRLAEHDRDPESSVPWEEAVTRTRREGTVGGGERSRTTGGPST
jgi:putative addiction module component (TIGR02574 family)